MQVEKPEARTALIPGARRRRGSPTRNQIWNARLFWARSIMAAPPSLCPVKRTSTASLRSPASALRATMPSWLAGQPADLDFLDLPTPSLLQIGRCSPAGRSCTAAGPHRACSVSGRRSRSSVTAEVSSSSVIRRNGWAMQRGDGFSTGRGQHRRGDDARYSHNGYLALVTLAGFCHRA